MTDRPQTLGGCCGSRDDSVTQLKLYGDDRTVGIRGLFAAFDQLRMRGCSAEGVTDAELLEAVRGQRNYIPDRAGVEAVYAAALRREFAAYCARPSKG